jgi:hypothetical protein
MTDLGVTLPQNELAWHVFGEAEGVADHVASIIYRWFTDPAARSGHPLEDHAEESRALVADLRAAAVRRDDPPARELGLALFSRSPAPRQPGASRNWRRLRRSCPCWEPMTCRLRQLAASARLCLQWLVLPAFCGLTRSSPLAIVTVCAQSRDGVQSGQEPGGLRRRQVLQGSERQLHLRLNPGHPRHPETGR